MTQDVRSDPGGLLPGEQVAGYQIQGHIGHGGMATVYRALDLRLGRLVALKILAGNLSADAAFRQRFIRESRAAAGVDHPNIIPVYEAGDAGGVLFIAMRYCAAGDLRSLIDTERLLSPDRAVPIISQVAAALDAAHGHGLVHRDVKPANVLLDHAGDEDDHVYLSDFGLSKHSLAPSTLTSTGQFLGTLDYVAPEQIQGRPVDGRADQYALACAAVEMLTGEPPFRRDDSMALMWAQLEAEPPRVTERRPGLPPGIDQVIATAMAKSPEGRYATTREFAAALSLACAEAEPRPAIVPVAESWDGPGDVASVADAGGYDRTARSRPDGREARDAAAPDAFSLAPDGWDTAPQTDWAGDPAGSRRSLAQSFADPVYPESYDDRLGDRYRGRSYSRPATPPGEQTALAWSGSAGQAAAYRPSGARPSSHSPSGFGPAGQNPSSRAASGPGRRGRTGVIAAVLVIVAIVAIGAVAYRLIHKPHARTPPAAGARQGTVPAVAARPAQTIKEYFFLINHHRYFAAWRISGEREPYATYAAGFAGTAHDTVTIVSVAGDVVTAHLIAQQTDGSVRQFQGTYTVSGGKITSSNVQRTS